MANDPARRHALPLKWNDLGDARADRADGDIIEIDGVPTSMFPSASSRYFVLLQEAGCCAGCMPRDPLGGIEVFAASPVPTRGQSIRLTGTWRVRAGSDDAWRYQLHDARPVAPPGWTAVTRRGMLATGPLMCLAAGALGMTAQRQAEAKSLVEAATTVDMHSHAGGVANPARMRSGERFGPVASKMIQGGMAAICLAIVSDGPTTRVWPDERIHPFRDPAPGELYQFGQLAFQRVHDMAREQGLAIIRDRAGLRAAKAGTASVIMAAEGADFLEGQVDRVDETFSRWSLRHLQLTHYRVNELGDIQTEAPVHGGLTDTGAEVVRRCNRLGIVVDVAHGTYDLVKRAVSVTSRPLILSHTSLTNSPARFTRLITPDHARAIASTGGVVGVWPPASTYPSLTALAAGMARLADVVGVDHVGLGSDMRGLVGASIFPDYDQLPGLAAALIEVGFNVTDASKILGGNYARVFEACMV